ncbi:DUF3750 domain-containing protein [Marinimicrococcus flavescens]|uniref:DUF3750 domain-containing protein n=1 Tax=Marinimicrococcus flavescens TaxID=3031815 RepID=A0AAP3XSU3_9PROT|nr:DUF3750 domain-containing protein [Marinimicrococcus flavescens]
MKLLLAAFAFVLLPIVFTAGVLGSTARHWSTARWDSAGLAPAPAAHPGPVVQVYAARAWGWKGAFAVHSWIVLKPENAEAYERWDVVGWGVGRGLPAVRRNIREPDGYWAGSRPELVGSLEGAEAAAAIPRIQAAIERYPYRDTYRTWPGPNSNTFVAWLIREVPELKAEMPANAVGKDFLGTTALFAAAPSKTGFQISLFGLLGLTLALQEGVEVNFMGLVLGLDPQDLAIKLPGVGRLGMR